MQREAGWNGQATPSKASAPRKTAVFEGFKKSRLAAGTWKIKDHQATFLQTAAKVLTISNTRLAPPTSTRHIYRHWVRSKTLQILTFEFQQNQLYQLTFRWRTVTEIWACSKSECPKLPPATPRRPANRVCGATKSSRSHRCL